jgi:hypothetical protein
VRMKRPARSGAESARPAAPTPYRRNIASPQGPESRSLVF